MDYNRCMKLIILYVIGIYLEVNVCNCEDFYTSISALEEIFIAEKSLMNGLASYVEVAEENIYEVKSFISDLKNNDTKWLEKSYSLLLTKGLKLLPNLHRLGNYVIKRNQNMAQKFTNLIAKNKLPNAKDLEGASLGLIRIEEYYDISAEQIANGIINDLNFGVKFTASDCFEVGLKMQELNYYYDAIEWYKMALKLLKEDGWQGVTPEVDEILVLKHLTYAQHLEGSIENAKAAIETSIKALNVNYYKSYSIDLALNLKACIENYQNLVNGVKVLNPAATLKPLKTQLPNINLEKFNLIKRGCRGELKKSPEEERKLFCKFETKNHPFLLLAPIKVEILNLSPYLVLFHDFIYDSEIKTLYQLSKGMLRRAKVHSKLHETGEYSKSRISKTTSFDNKTHPLMHTLNQRIYDITGLTMETSEDYEIINYGVAGHNAIHSDFLDEIIINNDKMMKLKSRKLDNRIATVLFYLSDVARGGATSWPHLNVLALPKKGTAVFWYNLYADGKGNYRTNHLGCPVILGSKWVLTKWIGVSGQVFRKPCYLYPDHLEKR